MNEKTPLNPRKGYGATAPAPTPKPAAAAPKPTAADKQPATSQDTGPTIGDYFTVSFWFGSAKNQVAQANGYSNIASGPTNGK